MNTTKVERVIAKGKSLAVVKKILAEELEADYKARWYSDKQAEYNELFPMYRPYTDEEYQAYLDELEEGQTTLSIEQLDVAIDYSEDETYVTFNDWLNETVVITEAVEEEVDEEGNVIVEGVAEVTEMVHPYIAPDNFDIEIDEYLANSSLYQGKVKTDTLDRLTVTTSSGKVFYADTDSRLDLQSAIDGASLKGLTSTYWKLVEEFEGNRVVEVTLDEIREASALALEAKALIVGVNQ